MRKIASLVLVVLLSVSMTGCFNTFIYNKDDPHFWTVAISSILGVRGSVEDVIEIIEEDEYGRTMFSFETISNLVNSDYLRGIIICQKYDEKYVYYYEDYNFILAKEFEDITGKEIEELKETNDWGKEIREEKLFRTEITRKKIGNTSETGDQVKSKYVKEVYTLKMPQREFNKNYAVFLVKDEYKRHIYFFSSAYKRNKEPDFFAAIINKDGTYNKETCIMQITDIWNYQDELKAFKELNNWNKPL